MCWWILLAMIFLNLECSSLNSPVNPIERFTAHYLYLLSSLFFGVIIYKVIFIFVSSVMIFLNLECASLNSPLTRIESTKIYRLHIIYLYLFSSLFVGVIICKDFQLITCICSIPFFLELWFAKFYWSKKWDITFCDTEEIARAITMCKNNLQW